MSANTISTPSGDVYTPSGDVYTPSGDVSEKTLSGMENMKEVRNNDSEGNNVISYSPDTYFIYFRAKLGLYSCGPDFGQSVIYPPNHFEKLVDEETYNDIRRKIRNLNLPADLLSVSFDCTDCTTNYFMNSVFFSARFTTSLSKTIMEQEMDSYLSCFNEIAFDTYLEGDAVVYREVNNDEQISYELVMDDIEVLVYNHDYTNKVCSMMSGTHWFNKK